MVASTSAHAGVFSGRVYDAASGYPIQCAELLIGNSSPSIAISISCDSAGYYTTTTIADLTDYTVLTPAPGYESSNLLMQTPHANTNFSLSRPNSGCLVETVNQGLVLYELSNGICRRVDGNVTEFEFPNIDADNE
ncbi:MAG: hypothetical protein WBP29_05500, partial [Candidatus Zixiibacteriota bacterium]